MIVIRIIAAINLDGQCILGDGNQSTIVCTQTHVSVTYGLLNAAVQNIVKGLGVLGPLNTVNVQSVVDHLSCVLTRQTLLQSRVYIVQNASSACVLQYVGAPCRTGQTSLVRVVTRYYEQHLSSFNAGYRRVRVKLVVALTSDNALGLAELDVALCPVVADVSQLGVVALISRVVDLVVAYNEDHLGHFARVTTLFGW